MAAAKRINYRGVQYHVYWIEAKEKGFLLTWKDGDGRRFDNFHGLRKWVESKGKKLQFATNAGIFEVGYTPLGLHVENRKKLVALNRNKGRGNFYLQPNGVFAKTSRGFIIMSTKKARRWRFIFASQSGPLLVINNRINPVFRRQSDSLYIRNAVGIDRRGRAVFVISNSAVNFYTLASLFRNKLKCKNALYLDGSISAMYLPELGRYESGGNFAGMFAVVK